MKKEKKQDKVKFYNIQIQNRIYYVIAEVRNQGNKRMNHPRRPRRNNNMRLQAGAQLILVEITTPQCLSSASLISKMFHYAYKLN